jgi:predicted DNA-binding protein (MmcQ/YjbR family)
VEHLGRSDWIYQFVLRDESELDDEVRDWIREAYDVGRQTHLAR